MLMVNDAIQTEENKQINQLNLEGIDDSFSVYLFKKWTPLLILLAGAIAYSYYRFQQLGLWGSLLIAIYAISFLEKRFDKRLYSAFAKANNFNFNENGVEINPSGSIFNIGREIKFSDMVTGSYDQWPLLLYIYSYSIGYGKNKHTSTQTVMSIAFNCKLPSFMMQKPTSDSEIFKEFYDEIAKKFGGLQRVSLEGNFDKHFSVWINPGTQDDVLSILTPDVMELLLGLDQYEVELTKEGTLYIYSAKDITKKQQLKDMYSVVQTIIPKIARHVALQKNMANANSITKV